MTTPLPSFSDNGNTFYVITPEHTIYDVLRFLILEAGGIDNFTADVKAILDDLNGEEIGATFTRDLI